MIKKLIKDYTTVIFGTALGRGLSFAIFLILARGLGVKGFGVFSLFFTVMVLAWQLPIVIDVTYVRYVKAGVKENAIDYLRITFFIKSIISILLLLLAYPIGHLLAFYIFDKPDSIFYLTAAIMSGGFLSLFATLGSIYQAQERFIAYSILGVVFYASVFLVIGGLSLFHISLTPTLTVLVYVLSASVAGSFGVAYLYNKTKPLLPMHLPLLSDMFHFGKWLIAANVTYIIFQRLDVLVLARFVSYENLGIYSVAVRVAVLASLLTTGISVVFMPRGCKALKSKTLLQSYLRESLVASLGLTIFIIALIITSPTVIKILFGPQYSDSSVPAGILLSGCIFVVLYTPLSYLFYAAGDSRSIFDLGMVRLVTTIGALFFLVPLSASIGAAIAIAFSSFCGLVFVAFKAYRMIKEVYDES